MIHFHPSTRSAKSEMGSFFQFQLLCFLSAIIILIHFCQVTIAQPNYRYHYCEGANYTSNSQFQRNLNLTISSLPSNITANNRFYNNSVGQNPDRVYGILFCRKDLTNEACKNCADTAAGEVTKRCPNSKEFISWYDDCLLRYSDKNIFSVMQVEPSISLYNTNDITNPEPFYRSLKELMDGLVKRAASDGDSNIKFATAESNTTDFKKIYGLVECTPDISGSDCNKCLRGAVAGLPSCCFGRPGGRILKPSCYIRYEIYPYYDSMTDTAKSPFPVTIPPPPPNGTTSNGNGGKSRKTVVIIAVVASSAALILLSAITIVICFWSRKRKPKEKVDDVGETENVESLQFNFDTIRAATDTFSDVNKVGEGGFGVVYKGRLPNGEEIAVKRLSSNSGQGLQEFKNEVLIVSKLQHRNLVRILGFSFKDEEKLLIYQFMPNKGLDHFIFDPIKRAQLNWETRYKIIGGIGRGLLYLHEDSSVKIIHRDLKASNVLLDGEMNPKISDFGMARLFLLDQTRGSTDRIVGTYGYMSPEYAMHGQFSVKSDVYSFGVLVLEIVSGRRNTAEPDCTDDLLTSAWRHWETNTPLELIDPTIRDCFSKTEAMICIHIGLLCVQDDVTDRPTMASVVHMLSSHSTTLPLPSPAFFMSSRKQSG